MAFRVRLACSVFLLAICGITSCSQHVPTPSCAPVSGVVTLNGKAVAGVRVTLEPQFSMGRYPWHIRGETGPEGKFIISTGATGDGAPPGDYIITFTKPRIDSDSHGLEIEVDDFQGKYSDPDTSEWMVKIENGENELEPFDLR